jgi:hypothetical protein
METFLCCHYLIMAGLWELWPRLNQP